MLTELKPFEDRVNFNKSRIGKALGGTEWVYDQLLRPQRWTEYLFRRPMFVGQLDLELRRAGFTLKDALTELQEQQEFDFETMEAKPRKITREILDRAINAALEFTYAYNPAKDGPGMEPIAARAIEFMNKLGPLNFAVGEPFAKAVFNGMKFMYEFSPVAMVYHGGRVWKGTKNPESITDPVTGIKTPIQKMGYQDFDKLAKGMIGSAMYAIAYGVLKAGLGGDEWWQIRQWGKKTPDGRPVYLDVRRFPPFSNFLRLADLVERIRTGASKDIDLKKELTEAVTGLRRVPGGSELINAIDDYWNGEMASSVTEAGKVALGRQLAIPLTPLLNLRDAIADWDEQENERKDLKGQGFLGPSIDRIPFLRSKLLPGITSPVEPGPIKISESPGMAQGLGIRLIAGENFAGREWKRLGFANRRFIDPDPDPVINRAQNEFFQEQISRIGEAFEGADFYTSASDEDKAAFWERFVGGDDGIAAQAKRAGRIASPMEGLKRDLQEGMPGPLQRKSLGLDKVLEGIKQ
jgi:hypothetical protein